MPAGLTLTFHGDVQLDRTLSRFEAAEDATPAWEVLADRFARLERRQFATEGAYGSGGWPALSPRYGTWKAKNYPGAKILHREGDLEESLTQRPFGVEVLEPGFMILGSGVDHGAYHQQGDGVPRRRPIEFPESERRAWMNVLQRFIVTGKAGR